MMKALILILVFLCLPLVVSAQEKEEPPKTPVDVAEISLEDLLNTEVTVAGKAAQKISDAPAIISVLTAEDIQRMGATNLYEVLNFVPGVHVEETHFGYPSVVFRGNLQTHYNNKSLMLINNHPIYETPVGSFYLEQVPISMVKRIEIIRGPGSTLYGTNAFAGVIKIVTKTAEDLNGLEVGLMGGSFSTIYPSIAFGKKFGDFSIAAGGDFLDSKGWDFTPAIDEDGRTGTIKYRNNVASAHVTLGYKGFTLNAGYAHLVKDKFGLVGTLVSTGERKVDLSFFDLTYTAKVGEKLDLTAMAYYNSSARDELVAWYPPLYALFGKVGAPERLDFPGNKFGVELQGAYQLIPDLRLTGGLMYEGLHSDPCLWYNEWTGKVDPATSAYMEDKDSYDVAGYLQADARLVKKLGLVAGVRYNYNKDFGSKVTPRVGLVFSATDKLSFKALYGNAYRSPSFFEKYVRTVNVVDGDPNLLPEQINTIDLGLDFMFAKNNNLRLNYFYLSTADLINRSGVVPAGQLGNTKPTPLYANSDGQKVSGIEVEVRGQMVSHVMYFGNLSYTSGTEKSNDADIMFLPELLANAGFHIDFASKFTLSPTIHYVGKREGNLAASKGSKAVASKAYMLANLNLQYRISPRFTVSLVGKNLFDTKYYIPEYVRRLIAEIPGGPGFAMFVRLTGRF